MTDWLCALDDAIVGRLEHCTLCGMRLGGHAWHAIEQVGALAVAEPSVFLTFAEGSAERFAAAIVRRAGGTATRRPR